MSGYTVDFSDVETREPLRPGKYDVVIDSIEMKKSETSDYPYLNWKVTVVGGEFEGRTLYMVTSLSPKALWKLQETFTSYGLEAEQVELDIDETTNMLLSPSLEGQPGIATVFNEKYQNRITSKISDLVGPGSTEEAPVPTAKPASNGPTEGAAKEKVNPFAKSGTAAGKRVFK